MTVLLLGDCRSGKSTFLRHYSTGSYSNKYDPTTYVETTYLSFESSQGPLSFFMKECPGFSQGTGGQYSLEHQECDGIFLFVDLTSKDPHLSFWYSIIQMLRIRRRSQIPVVLCGNKCDAFGRRDTTPILSFAQSKRMPFFAVSALTLFNCIKPFEALASMILGRPDLQVYDRPLLVDDSPDHSMLGNRLVSIAPSQLYYPDLSLCKSTSIDTMNSNDQETLFALES